VSAQSGLSASVLDAAKCKPSKEQEEIKRGICKSANKPSDGEVGLPSAEHCFRASCGFLTSGGSAVSIDMFPGGM
jgi:hypothetical protein